MPPNGDDAPNGAMHADHSGYSPLSDTYVIRKSADAETTGERCYICLENWPIGGQMVRLRCCNYWLHELCLSMSVLDGQCPICRVWLTSFDDVIVLSQAAETGNVTKVQELLKKDTPCTEKNSFGQTPLHSAVFFEHRDVVEAFLNHGVNTSTANSKGQTPLHLAAQCRDPGILVLLLERGADIKARDDEGMTALHFAYQKGVIGSTDFLIKRGAEEDARTKLGLSPEMLHPSSVYSQFMRSFNIG